MKQRWWLLDAKFVDYKEIDKPPEEKVRGIAINATHLEFETEDRLMAKLL